MTTRVEQKMLSVIFAFVCGRLVELADTRVLGTRTARCVGSTPSSPTSLGNNTGVQICCSRCCIGDKMLQYKGGMCRQDIGSRRLVSLRIYQLTSYIPTTAYSSSIATSIF